MFRRTHTTQTRWVLVRTNDKKTGRPESMRSLLARFGCAGKDHQAVGNPAPRSSARWRALPQPVNTSRPNALRLQGVAEQAQPEDEVVTAVD
jgi:hypothetical protein